MDTRMIDVVIGLALVFALTSLLATALQELWTSLRGLRGRYLLKAVQSFFADDLIFADALLKHPLIVSLSQDTKQQTPKPSYMTADVLITALIAHLSERHAGGQRPATPGEFVALVKAAVQQAGGQGGQAAVPNADFLAGLNSLVMGVEHDWPAYEARLSAWYDAVCTRSIGWFKRHTQVTLFVFGFGAAALANINPVVISARLWEDEALREATLAVAKQATVTYQAQVAAQAASGPASGAASGAAPRLPPLALAAPAPRAAAALPTPSPTVATPAAAADGVAERMAALHAATLAALKSAPDGRTTAALQRALRGLIELRGQLKAQPADVARLRDLSAQVAAALPVDAVALRAAHGRLDEALTGPPVVAGTGASSPAARLAAAVAPSAAASAVVLPRDCAARPEGPAREYCVSMNNFGVLQSAGLPVGWDAAAWPRVFKDGCDQVDDKGVAVAANCRGAGVLGNPAWWGNYVLLSLFGWCMTAVACTLGAPFWFDALSKLVKLRSSGGKSDDGGAAASTAGAGSLPKTLMARSPATAEAAAALPEAGGPAPMSDAFNDAERALSVAEVERLQRGLKLSGVQVSGHFDAATRQAIKQWQGARGFEATAELTALQIQDLMGLAPGSDDDGYLA